MPVYRIYSCIAFDAVRPIHFNRIHITASVIQFFCYLPPPSAFPPARICLLVANPTVRFSQRVLFDGMNINDESGEGDGDN